MSLINPAAFCSFRKCHLEFSRNARAVRKGWETKSKSARALFASGKHFARCWVGGWGKCEAVRLPAMLECKQFLRIGPAFPGKILWEF